MATVTRVIAASPAQVFAVLADGWSYSNWVVGTSHMRAVESSWPAVGARVHHATGIWPSVVRDETVVEVMRDEQALTLLAKGGPLGNARVVIELTAQGDATRVSMLETPTSGPGKWLHNPVAEAVLTRRNVESLARLAAIAERRTHPVEKG